MFYTAKAYYLSFLCLTSKVLFKDIASNKFSSLKLSLCERRLLFFAGNYSVLGVRFVFSRRIGHYLTRVYIPAVLIVLMSWLSFFVNRESAPARVSLGITTVLTMTTLLIRIGQGSLPVVSYVKAVDWYLIVCYTLVFGAFAEYVLMNSKKISTKVQTTKVQSTKVQPTDWNHQLVSSSISNFNYFHE